MSEEIANLLELVTAGEWGNNQGTPGGVDTGVIRSANFTKDHQFNTKEIVVRSIEERKRQKKMLQHGDILIEKSGGSPDQPVGRVLFYDLKGEHTCSNFISILRPTQQVDPKFLYYSLCNLYGSGVVKNYQQQTTGIINLQLGEYLRETIYHPPLPEQKKIAEILSGIDRRSNLLSKQIAKEDALFTSFQDQLLESIASTAFAPIHRHDSHLKILPIANLFEVQLGKMLNKEAKEHGHQFQYLGNKNIQQWNPDIRHLELMHFSEDEKRKFSLRSGDLLVCEGGDAGRCCIWEETDAEIYYQKAIHRMRPRSGECTPTFMMHYLAYCKSRNLLTDFISKTSISHLTREKLLEIPIAIPSREEQSSIVEKLESQRKLIAKLFSKSKILKDIKSAVSSDLLSGRKRVTI